jgi:predicted GIY-YIG superfamily endonuclease
MTRSEAMHREKEIKGKKSRKYIENLLGRQSPESVRD